MSNIFQVTDLFSHKIHSSKDDWPEKLTELACIFGEFDGKLYDRNRFEERLRSISPRVAYFAADTNSKGARDISKFRDEISAYPAYLGLYSIIATASGWVVKVSNTAKRFLLCEEPDVASFLRIQLSLFQYPNANGAVYNSKNKTHIQANARERTLNFIKNNIHLSPLRLIITAMYADASLRKVDISESKIHFDEIFCLANCKVINKSCLPDISIVQSVLNKIRIGHITPPKKYESRFHILKHTEIFEIKHSFVKLRPIINDEDRNLILKRLSAICQIHNQFDGFDNCKTKEDLSQVICEGVWGEYFDGVKILPSKIIDDLSNDNPLQTGLERTISQPPLPKKNIKIFPFRNREISLPKIKPFDRQRELTDPDITKIKRQRRNLKHKELVEKMDSHLRRIGASPLENEHIDLYAKIPNDGSFIFEMKSGGENYLDQIRKGLSQLYEYQYRYRSIIQDSHISLCLVLTKEPEEIPWIIHYLCHDRGIGICWFNENDDLEYPELCSEQLIVLNP